MRSKSYRVRFCGAVAAALLLLLTACGGGGSSSRRTVPPVVPDTVVFSGDVAGVPGSQVARAAQNTPRSGSVTQGTRADGSAVTLDQVESTFVASSASSNFQITINTDTTPLVLSSADLSGEDFQIEEDFGEFLAEIAEELPALTHPRGRSLAGIHMMGEVGTRWLGTAMLSDAPAHRSAVQEGGVDVQDHISFGIWAYGDVDPNNGDMLSGAWGAFADGVETPVANIPRSGTANYDGHSFGVHGDTNDDDPTDFFVADVELTADFGSARVSGNVDNLRLHLPDTDDATDRFIHLHSVVVDLQSAPVVNGFFTGAAAHRGGSAVGKWGGQFFGVPATGSNAPPAIGGTWGVQDNDLYIAGGFGAWLRTPTP